MAIPLEDENVVPSRPVVNTALILANIAVFIIGVAAPGVLLPGASSYDEIINRLGMIPYYVVRGERLHTLFTSMFLHAGLVHLFGNMLYLYIFGDNVEAVMGKARYLAFYLCSGLTASLFHILSIMMLPSSLLGPSYAASPWLVPAIGASGAISGVLGAYLILYPGAMLRVVMFWGWLPLFLRLPASVYILFWFAYQLFLGLVSLTGLYSTVAFWAHIGGFLGGIALLPLFVDKRKLRYYRMRAAAYWDMWSSYG